MRVRSKAGLAATLICASAAGLAAAAPAEAAHHTFCTNVLLQSGRTCVTSPPGLWNQVAADPLSQAKACAQSVSPNNAYYPYGQNCSTSDGERIVYTTNAGSAAGNAAVHDHSEHQGRFNGSYDD